MQINVLQKLAINLEENKNATTQQMLNVVAESIEDLSKLLVSLNKSLAMEKLLPN